MKEMGCWCCGKPGIEHVPELRVTASTEAAARRFFGGSFYRVVRAVPGKGRGTWLCFRTQKHWDRYWSEIPS